MRSDLFSYAAVAASVISPALGFWRLPCQGRLGVARMDPIVDPGKLSSHAHSIHGAGNFALSVTPDLLLSSDCTSCAVKQDMSNYWVPSLYFMHPDGSAELVDQVGGTLVYYLLRGENLKAFPQDFRMVAGDPFQRNLTFPKDSKPRVRSSDEKDQFALMQQALGFNCLNYAAAAEPSLGRHEFPDKAFMDANCKDGLRLELAFPSCWNGKDLDSHDHKSHIMYPDQVQDGNCPDGFETRTVTLFYETIWATQKFAGKAGEFMLSNGDPTGYGYHGDVIAGWEDGILQQAIEQCTDPSGVIDKCPVFELQDQSKQNDCKMTIPSLLTNELYDLTKKGLPGDVPVMRGPAYAKGAKKDEPSPPPKAPSSSASPSSSSKAAIPSAKPAEAKFFEKPADAGHSMEDIKAMPAPTPPPEPVEPAAEEPIRTTTYTEGNTVYEVAIMQEEVTQTVTAESQQKRHAHAHAHARRHH